MLLSSMFEKGKISPDDTAAQVHKLKTEIQKYNLNVFRGAFNQLRALNGFGCKLLRIAAAILFF